MRALRRYFAFIGLFLRSILCRQPLASALSIAAVALAAHMVVRVTCSFSASSDRLELMMQNATLHYDRMVTEGDEESVEEEVSHAGISATHPALPDGLEAFLRTNEHIAVCVAGSFTTVEAYPGPSTSAAGAKPRRGPPQKRPGGAPPRGGKAAGTPPAPPTDPMFRIAGWRPGEMMVHPYFAVSEGDVPDGISAEAWDRCLREGSVAVPSSLLKHFDLQEGDSLFLAGNGGRTTVSIGASYESGDGFSARELSPIYAPRASFEPFTGDPWRMNRAYLQTKPGHGAAFDDAFRAFVAQLPAESTGTLLTPDDWRASMAPMARGRSAVGGFNAIPYSSVFLASMAALFLLLSTLAMNIQRQTREWTTLRTIGAPGWLLGTTVLLQGLFLAFCGWLVGAILGFYAFRATLPEMSQGFGHVLNLAKSGLALSTLPILLATVLASVPAIWMVSRLYPLETAAPSPRGISTAFAWGAAMVAIHPLLARLSLAQGPLEQSLILLAAYLLAMLGTILMAPGLLRFLARVLARPFGRLLGLHPMLLRDHNQSGLWQQTLGASALLVSLAFYLTTAIWGDSMKTPFLAGEKVQDAIAMYLPNGPLPDQAGAVSRLPGVVSNSPMRLTHLQLASVRKMDGKIFAGNGEVILLNTDLPGFLQGISHQLLSGRLSPLADGECVILNQMPLADPESYQLGKPFEVYPLDAASSDSANPAPLREPSALTPIGILDIPGWQLLTKSTRMRRGMMRSLSLIFVNAATFNRYAPDIRENCHWLTLAPDADWQSLQNELNQLRPFPAAYVKLTNIAAAENMIRGRTQSVLTPLLRLPLMVLGLSTLAVLVSLVAAAHARRHSFALLEALGLTRGPFMRLLLGEALLLALTSILLGTGLALLFARTGIILCNLKMLVHAPFIFPFRALGLGMGVTLAATVVAVLFILPSLCSRDSAAKALSGSER